MVERVDTQLLKSCALRAWGFESPYSHLLYIVAVAEWFKAVDCDSSYRGFKSCPSPSNEQD